MAVTTAKASMSDQWLDGKGEMSDEEPATPAEVKAIKEFLCGLVAPSIAAKRLMDPREDEKHLDDKLNRIAWLIMDCILHYQAQQTLLIDLLDAIHHLADDELNFTAKQKLEHPDWRTWKYLGRFELLVDETLRSSEAYRFSLDDEDEDPRDAIRRWASLNSFMAHRCVHEKANDLLVYGVDLIEKTVEQGFANEGQRGPIDTGILDVSSFFLQSFCIHSSFSSTRGQEITRMRRRGRE